MPNAPVWVLSVDLQTKTATFQSGMADAARSARTAFTDIKQSAGEMGRETTTSVGNVRAALGLFDNTIRGNHAAAMADLIREFSHTSIVMAALPFAAVAGGLLLLGGLVVAGAEKLREWREEQQRLADESMKFGTSIQEVFNNLDKQILQASLHSDELRNDHLAALRTQLELINKEGMGQLVRSLEDVAKAADGLFEKIKGNWYSFGIGSDGAKHALEEFQTQYRSLLNQGKDKEASDLLRGTLESAKQVLNAQKAIKENAEHPVNAASRHEVTHSTTGDVTDETAKRMQDIEAARLTLKQAGVSTTEKEVLSQQSLVDALNAQVEIETKIGTLKKLEGGNAGLQAAQESARVRSEAAKEGAAHAQKMGEIMLAADRSTAVMRAAVQRETIAERESAEIAFADREYRIQMEANAAEIAALDKFSKDYQNQLKSLHDKAEEITAEHTAKVSEIQNKAAAEQFAKTLRDIEQSERGQIDATQQGSQSRVAAIGAALKQAEAMQLQDTDYYRELQRQRVEATRQMAEEDGKLRQEAGREAADNDEKMGALLIARAKEQQALVNSAHAATLQQRIRQELDNENMEYALKLSAMQREIDALDKNGKDYENKLRQLQDKELQMVRQHENDVAAIKNKAETQQNTDTANALAHMRDLFAQGFTQVLMRHQSFAQMMDRIGSQVASSMMQTAIQSALSMKFGKEEEAASAARKMFLAGTHFPFPVNIVMAPLLGAAAFASVMAFQDGTDSVPGVGKGDKIPAMLEPGEGVVPGGVMDGLRTVARNGGFQNGQTTHVHFRPVYHVQAIDGNGVRHMLRQHSQEFQRHIDNHMRKQNRS
jgi:hypothetical protein